MNEFPRTLKIATVWLLLGIAVFLGFRAMEHRQQQSRFQATGGVIEIRRGPDGHYHWPGSINGLEVDFLIDTGATGTAMSQSMARQLQLDALQRVQSNTAGGVVSGDLVRADLVLHGGVRFERLAIVALPGLGDRPLLGMDVLGRLRWQQRDGVLTIDT
ncbi:MAG TPA: retropepsin-like aspartic protease, partial [Rhizobacter sp.]|nr:retropepsin-like aspartic protease [Rhizobacter sp.]